MLNKNNLNTKCEQYRVESNHLFSIWKQVNGTIVKKIKKTNNVYSINHADNVFVTDGVVCPEQWFSQDIRPLFLLKEAYGGDCDWDLTNYLCSDASASKLWQRVAEWSYGLQNSNTQNIISYKTNLANKTLGNEWLKRIAVVNIKKSCGEKESDMDMIRAYGEFDKVRLQKQLTICDPTIIVCGYTASALDIIFEKPVRVIKNENLYYSMELNGHPVLILDYWHPSNQYPDIMNYYGLMGIYHSALNHYAKER